MARKKNGQGKPDEALSNVEDYRHKKARRKNNPPARIAAEGTVPLMPKAEYFYSPRRPPVLRFDADGAPDKLPPLLATARKRALTKEEAQLLAGALRTQDPWLEWAGKRESQASRAIKRGKVSGNKLCVPGSNEVVRPRKQWHYSAYI